MGLRVAALWLLAASGSGRHGARPEAGPEVYRVSSSRKRTWRAHSRLFYTRPTRHPPDAPPGRPTIASPSSMPS